MRRIGLAPRCFATPAMGIRSPMSEHERDGVPFEAEPTHDDDEGGTGSISGGAGEGFPGGPETIEPGTGPTSDEATGITGDPDDA